MSKRRKGFPSETRVKHGDHTARGGEVELLERLGNNDLCPCGSGRRFQELLPQQRPLLTAPAATTTAADVLPEPRPQRRMSAVKIKTFGPVDERSLKQLERCMDAGDAEFGV
ncbi:MAG: SEC-C metal-binding domain-containing protein, partial [Solirubrobacteraceae bacterium]